MACVEHAVFFFLHGNLRIQSITYLGGPTGSLEITRVNPEINCFVCVCTDVCFNHNF